jgi:ABC-type sugar transport system ATPase subunit
MRLKSVDFELDGGECVALLGENGAGKSTLIKVMGGAHQADAGSYLLTVLFRIGLNQQILWTQV